jgi:hypothetical protein
MNTDQFVAIMDDYTSLRQRMLDGIGELAEYFPLVKHTMLVEVSNMGFLDVTGIRYSETEGAIIEFTDTYDDSVYELEEDIKFYEISTEDLQSVLKSLIDTKNRQ